MPVNKIKVLFGIGVSFPHPKVPFILIDPNAFRVYEYENYRSISAIKPSPFDNFCIVTLSEPVNFNNWNKLAPLCLTKKPIKEFDEIKGNGRIFGFGYNEVFHDVFNSDADKHRMNQRQVKELKNIEIRSTSNCQFDKWDRVKSSFALKRLLDVNRGPYVWLEM